MFYRVKYYNSWSILLLDKVAKEGKVMKFNISVGTYNDMDAFDYINKTLVEYCKCNDIVWDKKDGRYISVIDSGQEQLEKAFKVIIEIYDKVILYADCSFSVREEDKSAEWWESITISTEYRDGKKQVTSSNETYWN